jgi:hypothetical protein
MSNIPAKRTKSGFLFFFKKKMITVSFKHESNMYIQQSILLCRPCRCETVN